MSLRQSRAVAVALVTFATFTDIVAYSVSVPVLPDLSRRFGASPTMIGFLFASFGVTLLATSMPMGALSDRVGRKLPMVFGLVLLAGSTILFAMATSLPWLFAARLAQGVGDAVTWVVGFALIADLYKTDERGRVAGIVMSGTSIAFMVGPSIGGYLYEIGGIRLPFLVVGVFAAMGAVAFTWFDPPREHSVREAVPMRIVLRTRSVVACAAAVIGASATLTMLEPVLPFHLQALLGIGPARVGLIFGIAALTGATMHPVFGRLADRWGAARMMRYGLFCTAGSLALLGQTWSVQSAIGLYVLFAGTVAMVVTPSLAYMAEAALDAGIGSFGAVYGLYNVAWGVGLLGGPALSGYLYERIGFGRLTLAWAPFLVGISWWLGRVQSVRSPSKELI